MHWANEGLYEPRESGQCLGECTLCLDVCPFWTGSQKTDSLAEQLYSRDGHGTAAHPTCGYYRDSFVGHVRDEELRWASSSGGIARWFLAELVKQNLADRAICVVPGDDPDTLFRYAALDSPDQIYECATSAYYPVELSRVLHTVLTTDARHAVVVLPCLARGLRLAMDRVPILKQRIVCIAGLVCGGMRTRYYAEVIARLGTRAAAEADSMVFRSKDVARPACEYSYRVGRGQENAIVPYRQWIPRWSSGELKPRACSFCDDVFSELADMVFMDAWLPEYTGNPLGTSLVVVRSELAERVLTLGVANHALHLESIDIDRAAASQSGVIHDKRGTLRMRTWLAEKRSRPFPPVRPSPIPVSLLSRCLIDAQEQVRRVSQLAILKQRSASSQGVEVYDRELRFPLLKLRALRKLAILLEGGRERFLPKRGPDAP
jgi:coenzyme F420-reducing hydrogenase beta subunit